ncbi:hypothetical protein [Pseudomonas sp. MWU13-2100]|uniref:hypothetical protein n=1 Tax=Pseudomonas sp. MWU13-2100 TaxID=2935075 RepID=UPI00200C49B0|nr:hypothetical protein [Pseudomonas sp. MWU13-2100]
MTIYIKTMPRERYRAGLIHSTNSYNYSKSAGIENLADRSLFNLLFDISRTTDTGFGLLVAFAINAYHQRLSRQVLDAIAEGSPVDLLHNESAGAQASGRMVEAERLRAVLNVALRADLSAPTHTIACRFWEHLYETVRAEEFPDKPKRLKSFFVFKDEETAAWYRNTHNQGELVCKVELTQRRVAFEADMTILDDIDETKNYAEALPEIRRYWRQEMNEAPRIEVLIQGQVKLLGTL